MRTAPLLTTALGVVALVLLSPSPAAATSASVCAGFRTCSDCACATSLYTVKDACLSGCGWVPELGQCLTAEAASAHAGSVAHLFPTRFTDDGANASNGTGATTVTGDAGEDWRKAQLAAGYVNCPLVYGGGTVITAILMPAITALWALTLLVVYCRNRRAVGAAPNTTWVSDMVTDHIPAGDTVRWQGVAKPRKPAEGGAYFAAATVGLFTSVPILIWLGIGLPTTIDDDWGFDFFYPIYFPGGLGICMMLVGCIFLCSDSPSVSGFAITNRRIVVVRADPKTQSLGTSGTVNSHNIGRVTTVGRTGDVVSFTSVVEGVHGTPAYTPMQGNNQQNLPAISATVNGSTQIRLAGLTAADSRSLFRMLQALADAGDAEARANARRTGAGDDNGGAGADAAVDATPVKVVTRGEDPSALSIAVPVAAARSPRRSGGYTEMTTIALTPAASASVMV